MSGSAKTPSSKRSSSTARAGAGRSRKPQRRGAAAAIDIPDFAFAALLHAPGAAEAAEATASRLFEADERIDPSNSPDLGALDSRLAARRLAALVAPAPGRRPGALTDALRVARERHAPIVALLLGDVAAPDGFHDPIPVDPAAPPELRRVPLPCDRRGETGPFDIIGDVHGCYDELVRLLTELGWRVAPWRKGEELLGAEPPDRRRALFVGDICDRGPKNVDALRLVMGMVEAGVADVVCGNHDFKLMRLLHGADVTRSHGLAETEKELLAASEAFRTRVRGFVETLPEHLWLDGGDLVVAHAGLREDMQGRVGRAVRKFALFGDVTGGRDEYGLPVRLDWAADYSGGAAVVYGHTPTLNTVWRNNTICIDSGCCFGGRLTSVRWPERDILSVPAARRYSKPIKPLDGG